MKKIAILPLLLAMFCFAANASTIITTSTVSGNWTVAGSPYIIKTNITVNSGQTLTIDPGVEVVFDGAYQFTVYGSLNAVGTPTSYIGFHVADTTGWYDQTTLSGGWKGLNLYPLDHATDSCAIRYCRISDTKWRVIQFYKMNLTLAHCEFFHNNFYNNGGGISGGLDSGGNYQFTMDHCSLQGNRGNTIVSAAFGKIVIHDCSFYNNSTVGYTFSAVYSKVNLFDNDFHHNTNTSTTVNIKYSEARIWHNVIHHNVSADQAAISLQACNNADINGNLIANNQSTKYGDGGSTCGMVQGGFGEVEVVGLGDF